MALTDSTTLTAIRLTWDPTSDRWDRVRWTSADDEQTIGIGELRNATPVIPEDFRTLRTIYASGSNFPDDSAITVVGHRYATTLAELIAQGGWNPFAADDATNGLNEYKKRQEFLGLLPTKFNLGLAHAYQTFDPDDGNTGTITTGGITLGANAQHGVYRLECTTAGATPVFKLTAPSGQEVSTTIGTGQVTTTHIIMAALAVATALDVGDAWSIYVYGQWAWVTHDNSVYVKRSAGVLIGVTPGSDGNTDWGLLFDGSEGALGGQENSGQIRIHGPVYRRTNSPTHPGAPADNSGTVGILSGITAAPPNWSTSQLQPTAAEPYVYVTYVYLAGTVWRWFTPILSAQFQTPAGSGFKGAWDAATSYSRGDITISHGTLCICSAATSLNQNPEQNPNVWVRIRNSAVPWLSTSTYAFGEHVSQHGKLYVLTVTTATGVDPSLTTQTSWAQIGGEADAVTEGILTRSQTEISSSDEYELDPDVNELILAAASVPVVTAGRFDDRVRFTTAEINDSESTIVWFPVADLDALVASDTYTESNSLLLYSNPTNGTFRALKIANGNLVIRKTAGTGTTEFEVYIDHIYFTESMDRVQEALKDIVGRAALEATSTELGRATNINTQQGLEKATNASLPTASGLDERIKVQARSPSGTGAWVTTWIDRSTLDGWTRNNSPLQASRLAVASAGSGNLELFLNTGDVFRLYASSTGAGVGLSYDIIIERHLVVEGFNRVEEAIVALARRVFTIAHENKLAGIEANATADQTAAEVRDLLAGLSGSNRLDAAAIKNIPGAALEAFEIQETVLRADASDAYGTGTFVALGFAKPTSRAAGSYADVFRFDFTRNGATTTKRVARADIAALQERTNHNDADARITLLSDSGFEIYLWSRDGGLPNSLRLSSPATTPRTYSLEVTREEYHLTSDAAKTALNNATATEPFLVGRVYRNSTTAANPAKPEDGSGDGNAAQGVVTPTGITTAPTGWFTNIIAPSTVWPWTHATECFGWYDNGVFKWKWQPVHIYDRYIHHAPFQGAWNATQEFFYAQMVSHNGSLWLCLSGTTTGTEPGTDSTVWTRIAHGSLEWNSLVRYERGLMVHPSANPSHLYVCVVASSLGTNPEGASQTDWVRLAFIPDGSILQGKLHNLVQKLLLPAFNAATANLPLVSSGASNPTWKTLPIGAFGDGVITAAKLAAAVVGRLLPSSGTTDGRALVKTASGWATNLLTAAAYAANSIAADKLTAAVRRRLLPETAATGQVAVRQSDGSWAAADQSEGVNPVPGVSGQIVLYNRRTSITQTLSGIASGQALVYSSATAGGGEATDKQLLDTYEGILGVAANGLGDCTDGGRNRFLLIHQVENRNLNRAGFYVYLQQQFWALPFPLLLYVDDDNWIYYTARCIGNSAVVGANHLSIELISVQAFKLSSRTATISNAFQLRFGLSNDTNTDTDRAQSHTLIVFRRSNAEPSNPGGTVTWDGASLQFNSLASWSAEPPSGSAALWVATTTATRPAGGSWSTSTDWVVTPVSGLSEADIQFSPTGLAGSWSNVYSPASHRFVRFRDHTGTYTGPINIGAPRAGDWVDYQDGESLRGSDNEISMDTNIDLDAVNFLNISMYSVDAADVKRHWGEVMLNARLIPVVNHNYTTTTDITQYLFGRLTEDGLVITRSNVTPAASGHDRAFRLFFWRVPGTTTGRVLHTIELDGLSGGDGAKMEAAVWGI